MNKGKSSELLEKMTKELEDLRLEVEDLKERDEKKSKQIKKLRAQVKELKEKVEEKADSPHVKRKSNDNAHQNLFNLKESIIEHLTEPMTKMTDISWIEENKSSQSLKSLQSLVKKMVEICNTPFEKKRDLCMIPLLKASENEFHILEEYIMQNKISVKFILFPTRKEYNYFTKDGEVKKIKEKAKTYQFTNTEAIGFDGGKLEKLPIQIMGSMR